VEFLIADTFTDSLTRLTNDEQKAVKTTAFDLQVNQATAGLNIHRLDRARDKRFWSVRVSDDVRIIIHRDTSSLLLCYADHHDAAYAWAERRKLEVHPKTGAAQLVEIRERVEEIVVPKIVEIGQQLEHAQPIPGPSAAVQHPLFADRPDEELLGFGVPIEWLEDVRRATEDSVLELADHLPREAAEALLELAVGGKPSVAKPIEPGVDPFQHPDSQRRFRVVANVDELERALAYPWEKWAVFLHPAQRESVERDYSGPARVAGSAGTGKTVVALHRALHLTRQNSDARVLLTTFSDPLARALRTKLRYLISDRPRLGERIEVQALDSLALRLHERMIGKPQLASREIIRELMAGAAAELTAQRFSLSFLLSEWEEIVDAWQIDSWEAYRTVTRLGRKTRLPEPQRAVLWAVFEHLRARLDGRWLVTEAQVLGRLAARLKTAEHPPFDFVVVDEAQDINVPQLRFLAALGGGRPNSLFFAGDLGQRIFQQPFSWKALGVDVRGRSRTLRVNYRTSHQIRTHADRLLGAQLVDVDGNVEERRGTVSVFNGPDPVIQVLGDAAAERACISQWLKSRVAEKVRPQEIGVFVRSEAELPRVRKAVEQAGLKYKVLDERVETQGGYLSVGTMHLAKGLEFRAVVVAACDDEVIPLQQRIESVVDESDLEDVYNTERHLLYVACTRARDHLLVTAVKPASEFLEDLLGS
jgi:hypothetical protein